MPIKGQLQGQTKSAHAGFHAGGRRAYMNFDLEGFSLKEEKRTQTDVGLGLTTKMRFVTPRLVLSSEETTNSPLAVAFRELCKRIRSPAWKSSLLVILGHDPDDKRRDELESKIREDEATETIDSELRAFFDTILAPIMQERETALVNTIHECVQQEMQSQQLVIQTQQQRLDELTQEIEEYEKQAVHLKAKVDRRVAENNALRKEQYRQLLMLRDIMSKQATEPGAMSAVNEAITRELAGKQQALAPEPMQNNNGDQAKASGRGWTNLNTGTQVLHREKEKWEHRAKEANNECQELRDEIARLTQENISYRASCTESVPWFLKPENAITERQRIADAVCSYQGKWEDVGDSLVELLNNDILWAAVEQSARRGGKRRIARGFEAVLNQIDSCVQPASIEEEAASEEGQESPASLLSRKRSTFAELGRLIPCRACNGVGYIHPEQGDNGTNDSDSYLRKTLEQVLELKTQLEKANTKTLALVGQLQLQQMHSAQLQETIHQAELIKTSAIDSCLQTDLDDEEGLDLDEIMRSAYRQDTNATYTTRPASRQNRRNTQYEHLIVELKSTLTDKDDSLAENRRSLDVAQARIVTLQRSLQKEKDVHSQELGMLKTSLAFSLKTRNSKIEERQAAVKLLMKKFAKKTPQTQPNFTSALPTMNEFEQDEDSDSSEEDMKDANNSAVLVETTRSEQNGEQHEVKRMEALVQRYAEDIIRVRKEYATQQELLQKAETEMVEEDGKRSRTDSISQGNLVVSLASHPRDLFKALSTAQADMLKLRRASQRSSTLQTDRLLTLTTHLGHMSEELCTIRKRNSAELEFWKLECEKLQNTNKALEAEQQLYQKQLKEARDDQVKDTSSGVCSMCEKHEKRLLLISKELLNQTQQVSGAEPEVELPAASALTEPERQLVSSVLMDLENIYSEMTTAKQQLTRELVATYLGNALCPRPTRRTTLASPRSDLKDSRSHNHGNDGGSPISTRTTASSPRKSSAGIKPSQSSQQLKRTGEALNGKAKPSQSPTRVIQEVSTPAEPEAAANTTGEKETAREIVSPRRKTLVQEILGGGGFSLTKRGLARDAQMPEAPEIEPGLSNNTGLESDNNADVSRPQRAHSAPLHRHEYDTQNANDTQDAENTQNADDSSQDADDTQAGEDNFALKEQQFPLLDGTNDIERDPEVIRQLRHLITESSAAKESLSISSWEILALRVLCVAGEQRLDQLERTADMRATIYPDGALRPSHKVASMCAMMANIVEQRKKALNAAISAREIARRDLKKTQAFLIHNVAMLLENLSRKGKPTIQLSDLPYLDQGSSPRKSPTSNRLFYPATKVHLNCIPQTQKIPTTTFPAVSTPDRQERQGSSKYRDEKGVKGSSYTEGYQIPHRLIKSAGPRPFQLVHSSIGALQGSMPFPDPTHLRNIYESRSGVPTIEGSLATSTSSGAHIPVRPRSSPAGLRFMSPRNHDFTPSTAWIEHS